MEKERIGELEKRMLKSAEIIQNSIKPQAPGVQNAIIKLRDSFRELRSSLPDEWGDPNNTHKPETYILETIKALEALKSFPPQLLSENIWRFCETVKQADKET